VNRGALPEVARVLLAGVRLVNGAASLFAPATFARKLGVDPETNGPAIYVLRMFGVRTILIANPASAHKRVATAIVTTAPNLLAAAEIILRDSR